MIFVARILHGYFPKLLVFCKALYFFERVGELL